VGMACSNDETVLKSHYVFPNESSFVTCSMVAWLNFFAVMR